MKQLLLLLAATGSISLAYAQAPTTPTYHVAVGVLGSYRTAGVLGEARLTPHFGLKLAGVLTSDGTVPDEYSTAGIGQVAYYLPCHLTWLEPVVGLGGIYTSYHWQQYGQSGTVRDLNVGGSFGANVVFHPRLRTGVQVFVANGFRGAYSDNAMRISGRRLLALPALTLEVLL
ncbi:hypothetical protein [Hymenobacter rubripertinctus]|uniref:Outer membrane protein beta-barrel domain-containing protein n=1 Tax=Hymenobacter rubripertinctus TaxID=2029981 RepID=A0A418QQL7_9BACT|nr:hypothetical protein [Hymenobacter rubripertinctus]RIY07378.1 hypothetical protein D0T11_16765 [Hymenobacter rubripertinctus]